MSLEILVATLIFALMLSVFDDTAAIIYALILSQTVNLTDWMVATLAFLAYYVAKQVARAVRG